MKTLKINSYGNNYEIYFQLGKYVNNNTLAIQAICIDEEGFEDYYGTVSVNLEFGRIEADNEFYADTNNTSVLISKMVKAKLIEDLGETCSSGFCIYPKMKTTEKFNEYVKVTED